MNHKVHHVVGLIVAEGALITFKQPPLTWTTLAGVVGGYFLSMAPDLDHAESFLSRQFPFKPLARLIEAIPFVNHRGLLHSILMSGILYVLLWKVLPVSHVLLWCFFGAYVSHIILDMFNAEGVQLLYPLPLYVKFLPPFIAVSSDEHSVVQKALYSLGSIAFYFLTVHLTVRALGFVPAVGPLIQHGWNGYVLHLFPNSIRDWLL